MAKFEVYPSKNGYRWRLKAGNGEVVATGEEYSSKDGAVRGCEAESALQPMLTSSKLTNSHSSLVTSRNRSPPGRAVSSYPTTAFQNLMHAI